MTELNLFIQFYFFIFLESSYHINNNEPSQEEVTDSREPCERNVLIKIIADTNKQTFRTDRAKILNNMNLSNLIAGETLKQCVNVPMCSYS